MIACRRHSKRVVQSRSFFRSFEFEGEISMGFHKPPKKYGAALGRAKFKLNAGWLVLLAVCIIYHLRLDDLERFASAISY